MNKFLFVIFLIFIFVNCQKEDDGKDIINGERISSISQNKELLTYGNPPSREEKIKMKESFLSFVNRLKLQMIKEKSIEPLLRVPRPPNNDSFLCEKGEYKYGYSYSFNDKNGLLKCFPLDEVLKALHPKNRNLVSSNALEYENIQDYFIRVDNGNLLNIGFHFDEKKQEWIMDYLTRESPSGDIEKVD